MKDTIYVTFDKKGISKTTKTPPDLKAGQHMVKVVLNVPDGVFGPNPIPTADLDVPASATATKVHVQLENHEDVCLNDVGVAFEAERSWGRDTAFRCPDCGFEYHKEPLPPHYRPRELEDEADAN